MLAITFGMLKWAIVGVEIAVADFMTAKLLPSYVVQMKLSN